MLRPIITKGGLRAYDAAMLPSHITTNVPKNQYVYASYSKQHGYKELSHDSRYSQKRKLIKEEYVKNHPHKQSNIPALHDFLNTAVYKLPVLYLFDLGSVEDLRHTFQIKGFHDSDRVVKFGLTKDLKRRSIEHNSHYGTLPNVVLNLKYHVLIEESKLYQTEKELKQFITAAQWLLKHSKYKELAVIPPALLETVVHSTFVQLGQRTRDA